MGDEGLLREFISSVVNERGYIRNPFKTKKTKKKSKIIVDRIKNFFVGPTLNPNEITSSWIEDQVLHRDISVDDDLKSKVNGFVNSKLKKALSQSNGNAEKAETLLKRALNLRFSKLLDRLEREQNNIDEF